MILLLFSFQKPCLLVVWRVDITEVQKISCVPFNSCLQFCTANCVSEKGHTDLTIMWDFVLFVWKWNEMAQPPQAPYVCSLRDAWVDRLTLPYSKVLKWDPFYNAPSERGRGQYRGWMRIPMEAWWEVWKGPFLTRACMFTSLQLCPTLCDPLNCRKSMGFSREEYWSGLPCLPPGFLIHLYDNLETVHSMVFGSN